MKLRLLPNRFNSRVWFSYLKKKDASITVWSVAVFLRVGRSDQELTTRASWVYFAGVIVAFFPLLIVKTHFLINSRGLFNLAGV